MLTLLGPRHRYCDGHTRRQFLQAGALAVGGLSLPQLLAAESASGRRSHKSVIMVYLSGGLSHHDTFDLKPMAPAEIRGEFQPISTAVPGVQFSELLPKLAQAADKLCVVRSLVGLRDEHSSFQNVTGYPQSQSLREGKPSFGSVVTRLQGPVDPVVPPFVDLFPTMQHRPYNSPSAGALGRNFDGAKADGEDLASMKLRFVESARFDLRRDLLAQFDAYRREVESSELSAADAGYERAFDVLTSGKLFEAMDVEREDPAVRERYGRGSSNHLGDGAPMWNDQLLVARRLVEAGVRCVTVAYGFWDTHGSNFAHLRNHLPLFDTGISALIEDIHQRGLDQDVTVLVWGEFGRTPKINANAGRDHWAPVGHALFAGGGIRGGQIIGTTDAQGAYPQSRRIHYQDVLATVYHKLGIDPHTYIRDVQGRELPILPERATPIRELA